MEGQEKPKPKMIHLTISDPVLAFFIDDYCKKMQKHQRDFLLDLLYQHFDNMGYGASQTRFL